MFFAEAPSDKLFPGIILIARGFIIILRERTLKRNAQRLSIARPNLTSTARSLGIVVPLVSRPRCRLGLNRGNGEKDLKPA